MACNYNLLRIMNCVPNARSTNKSAWTYGRISKHDFTLYFVHKSRSVSLFRFDVKTRLSNNTLVSFDPRDQRVSTMLDCTRSVVLGMKKKKI